MVTKTGNLQLVQPAYNSTGWDVHFNGNMAIIDAALSQFFVQNNFLGIWENSTTYGVGDVVVDSTNSNIYTCAVGHTSPASPTTFATYRTANPSHWTNTSVVAAAGRGTWATATAYVKGDFVVSGTVYAVCTTNHTSGATFVGDSAYWSELIDVSAAVVSDGSIDGAKFANPLTIPGATTITTGGLTVTAGGISVASGATTLQGTTVQSGGLTVTAGGIGVTAGGINVATGGLIVQAGGASITGNSTITGTLAGLTGLTVASGGLTVSTGGLTVTANGMTVTGNSTITGTLGGLTGLTVASGGATITSGGLTVTAGGITVSAGGATITGNSTVTGTLSATSTVTGSAIIPSGATVPANGMYLADTNSVALATNTTERVRFNASGALGLAGANYGTSGQVIVSAGSGAPPAWGTPSSTVTLISSGSLGTGTTKTITDIPETYSSLVLEIIGASCSANRSLRVYTSVDNGVTPDSVDLIDSVTAGLASSSDTVHASIVLDAYQSLPLMGRYISNVDGSAGTIGTEKRGLVPHSGNIDAFVLEWNGLGNFDAGTYNLYGIR